MHEQGIARDLVNRALREAANQGSGHLAGLGILLGPMGFAGKDALIWAVRQASQGTKAEGADIWVTETGHGGIVLESIELKEEY